MASEPFCVFECNSIGDKILLFTQEKLKKCREILTIRVALKLKYNDVNLPVTVTKTHGYHSKCYNESEIEYASDEDEHEQSDCEC
ncbi:unnamed protein product [Euphydryas editha]|uniref:Uncharacterized protein n=1 Tax=Euphydryas editha TaxID=104508 RepID=A0AAU9TSG8_EUPED|nr:unnamed protein product [Euphydryas editha]